MGFLMIFFVALIIVVTPFLTLWTVNTLFGLGIAYTLKTWFAALVLNGLLTGSVNNK